LSDLLVIELPTEEKAEGVRELLLAMQKEYLIELGAEPGETAYEHNIETTLDALADHLGRSLDLSALLAAARPPRLRRAA